MRDIFDKLRILVFMLSETAGYWKEQIWEHGLDDYNCCSGGTGSHDVCGCFGVTVRETYLGKNKTEADQ